MKLFDLRTELIKCLESQNIVNLRFYSSSFLFGFVLFSVSEIIFFVYVIS